MLDEIGGVDGGVAAAAVLIIVDAWLKPTRVFSVALAPVVGHASHMLLRLGVLSDVDAVMEVQHAGAVLALGHIFPQASYPFPREEIYSRWVSEIADPDVDVYVIEQQSRISGFAATRGNELLHFGTAVHTWGTGLAVTAHGEIMQRLAAGGVARARLRVFEDNHRAIRFYEKLGWHRTATRTRTPFPPHPVLVGYERDLCDPLPTGHDADPNPVLVPGPGDVGMVRGFPR